MSAPVYRFPSPLTLLERIVFAFCVAFAFFSFLRLPLSIAGSELDPSWNQAFNYFTLHRMKTGVDYIFTYGPMSFLITEIYDKSLFAMRLTWEFFSKALFIGAIWRLGVVNKVPLWRTGLLFLLIAVLFRQQDVATGDVFGYICLVVLGFWLLWDVVAATNPLILFSTVFLVAVFSLVKLTLLPDCLLVVALASYQWSVAKKSRIPVPFILFVLVWLGLWFGSGQTFQNMPEYIHGSAEITRGYGLVMIVTKEIPHGPVYGLMVCLSSLLFFATLLLWYQATSPSRKPSPSIILTGLLLLSLLFIAFKHGFVRADLHVLIPFTVLAMCHVFLGLFLPSVRWTTRLISLGGLLIAIVGYASFSNRYSRDLSPQDRAARQREAANFKLGNMPWSMLQNVLKIPDLPAALEGIREQKQQALPIQRIRSVVGTDTVDVWSYEQGIVLLHDMNYRPRPVFQGYSVYTPYLQEINAAFYRGENAPRYVLFKMQTVDDRFPTLDDSAALAVLLTRYQYLFSEGGYLLLERKPGPYTPQAVTPPSETIIGMDSEIQLPLGPGRMQFVSFDIASTTRARAVTAIWKPKMATIRVTFDDGSQQAYNLPPEMARTPFLVEPFLPDTDSVRRFMQGEKPTKHIRSFLLLNTPTLGGPFYRVEVKMHRTESLPDKKVLP